MESHASANVVGHHRRRLSVAPDPWHEGFGACASWDGGAGLSLTCRGARLLIHGGGSLSSGTCRSVLSPVRRLLLLLLLPSWSRRRGAHPDEAVHLWLGRRLAQQLGEICREQQLYKEGMAMNVAQGCSHSGSHPQENRAGSFAPLLLSILRMIIDRGSHSLVLGPRRRWLGWIM